MEPGIFYINQLKPAFKLAEAAANAAGKDKEKLLKDAQTDLVEAVRKKFGFGPVKIKQRDWDHDDFSFALSPGVEIQIDCSSLTAPKLRAAFLKKQAIEKSHEELCGVRCGLTDLMATSVVASFKQYIRTIYGSKPTLTELESGYKDFMERRGSHVCPVKRRR